MKTKQTITDDLGKLTKCIIGLYVYESQEEKREHFIEALKILADLEENIDSLPEKKKAEMWQLFLAELTKAGVKYGAQELFELVGNLI